MSSSGHPPPPGQQPPPAHEPPRDAPPPGYGYGPPPAYGYGYGPPYGAYAREHPQGTTILVLGILSLVTCQLAGPVAWVMGNTALAEIDANPAAYSNRSSVQTGRICGIVATGLMIFAAVIGVLVLVALAASTSST